MATFQTYQAGPMVAGAGGLREDLLDVIVNISPTETPMLSGFKKSKANGTLHEWTTDTLGTATNTTVVEGADFSDPTLTARVRHSNYCQINREGFQVSDTLDAVDKVGIKGGEYEYQLAKALKNIARGMEVAIVKGESAAGSASAARGSRGISDSTTGGTGTGWVTTNSATMGTAVLTEVVYNNMLQEIFIQGGNPDTTYAHGWNKRKISAFTAGSTKNIESFSKKLVLSVDVYESDFGLQRIILDRYMPEKAISILQKDMWSVAMLRPVKHTPLAKVGSSRRGMVESEWTLVSYNEKASGTVFNTSVA
tara:strand:- start:2235 stop:3161 length:927 start_codon:yes stop_codon:yes gene_type:complete